MVNASISLETKWILTTACQLEGAPWDHKFWTRIAGFPGTNHAWLEKNARAVWASMAGAQNAYLAKTGLKTYALEANNLVIRIYAQGVSNLKLREVWLKIVSNQHN